VTNEPTPRADIIRCPGATASRQHVIGRDARVCYVCGWVRGERDALNLQPLEKTPLPAPASTRRRSMRWLIELVLLAASVGVVAAVAVAAGLRLP